MRFIVEPIEDGVSPLSAAVPLPPLVDSLGKFGIVHELSFLSALTVDVSDDRLAEWKRRIPEIQRGYKSTVRPARVVSLIEPPTFEIQPPDPNLPTPNSLLKLGVADLWKLSILGEDVDIGVVDIGFDRHPSIDKVIKSHHHYVAATKRFEPGGFSGNTEEEQRHGTFAAALIAGAPIDDLRISVAPGASLHLVELPGVVFDDDLTRALHFLYTNQRCRVISISLGTCEPLTGHERSLRKARLAGALPVVAIGNDGKGVARWPGACAQALSVGYCGETGLLRPGSSSTQLEREDHPLVPSVLAPGVMLTSALVKGTTTQSNGSSVAAPLVAGLAGLLFSDCPTATPDQVQEAITRTCSFTAGYDDRCEFGLPVALNALELLRIITSC